MKHLIQPWIAKALSSDQLLNTKRWFAEKQRIFKQQPHAVHVFLKVDDPYSYVLLQALKQFESRYDVEFKFHIISKLQDDMFPEPKLWHQHAFKDAAHIASLYDFDYPSKHARHSKLEIEHTTQALLDACKQTDFIHPATDILRHFWNGQTDTNADIQYSKKTIEQNNQLLKAMGHYYSAMLYYGGEWYWGVDRLMHLEKRLNMHGLNTNLNNTDELVYDKTSRYFCQRLELTEHNKKRANKTLTLFFSARSPYSYLGLERTITLARHYDLPLEIKPVLPMMMRGMNVPSTKKWYIFHDTKREAKRLGIPYGFVADPLGNAVERCYALFDYASSEGKAADFLLSFARAVNSQGIRAETDVGLEKIVSRCGLDWTKAKSLLTNQEWRNWAQANYTQMQQLGLWGVPCLKYGDISVWGQDRIDVIEQAICKDIIKVNKNS